jgi:hypothetical protein
LGLEHAQDAEVMIGVLEIIFRHHPVARGKGVPRQLLVFFEHVLGVAANLDVFRAVRVEGAVHILLRLTPAAITAIAAAAIAAALTFHTLEVSHRVLTVCALIVRPALGSRAGACCAI